MPLKKIFIVFAAVGWCLLFSFLIKHLLDEKPPNRDLYYQARVGHFSQLQPDPNGLYMIGDSHIDRAEWQELIGSKGVYNRGIGRDTVSGVRARLESSIGVSPKIIFIMIGFNDLARGFKAVDIIREYSKLLSDVKAKFPESEVVVASLLPIGALRDIKLKNSDIFEFNSQLNALSIKKNVHNMKTPSFVYGQDKMLSPNFTNDGIHLNGSGYKLFGEEVQRLLESIGWNK
ncbi:Lysophospholipase L1 [Malonomonas rubra DSM 5091]|uniref:Lysophospholipase L1 n=1 Tax=Malonomonas rubra DSM 5091 TaxID=1122189 RepID=A0A1M6KDI2_MALRU|nr:GDSL-type esterase/lipase family protein [Malonomonas rubra]SHJ57014.1 Lysophospholipase L1 [Malonomonas rubra DSM 5091]